MSGLDDRLIFLQALIGSNKEDSGEVMNKLREKLDSISYKRIEIFIENIDHIFH